MTLYGRMTQIFKLPLLRFSSMSPTCFGAARRLFAGIDAPPMVIAPTRRGLHHHHHHHPRLAILDPSSFGSDLNLLLLFTTMVDATTANSNSDAGGDLNATFRSKASFMKGWKPASTPSVRYRVVIAFVHRGCNPIPP
jgi:hypothetical protein